MRGLEYGPDYGSTRRAGRLLACHSEVLQPEPPTQTAAHVPDVHSPFAMAGKRACQACALAGLLAACATVPLASAADAGVRIDLTAPWPTAGMFDVLQQAR